MFTIALAQWLLGKDVMYPLIHDLHLIVIVRVKMQGALRILQLGKEEPQFPYGNVACAFRVQLAPAFLKLLEIIIR
jgi:hypothetical protein